MPFSLESWKGSFGGVMLVFLPPYQKENKMPSPFSSKRQSSIDRHPKIFAKWSRLMLIVIFTCALLNNKANFFRRLREQRSSHIENPEYEFLIFANISDLDFQLSCPQPPPAVSEHNETEHIVLVYHVGLLDHWEVVVEDQMKTLSECGLGNISSKLIVTHSNGEADELRGLLDKYPFAQDAEYVESQKMPWEQDAIREISRECREAEESTIIFYFHNKGISRFDLNWTQGDINEPFSYGHSLAWRKYMEYFILERPHLCLRKLLNEGASTCGVNMRNFWHWHYSGNFWAARCDYINELPPINVTECGKNDAEYMCAELWLGYGIPEEYDVSKFVSFHNDERDMYRNYILPGDYTNVTIE